jgi:polysaccharide biosynthesis protein PslH
MIDMLWLGRSIPLPANSGDKIYTSKLVSNVAEAGAQVTYVGLADRPGDWDIADLDRNITWKIVPGDRRSILFGLLDSKPMVAARYGTLAYRRLLRNLLESGPPQVVILDQYGLVFALDELRVAKYAGPIVHIAHDFETLLTRDMAAIYSGNRLRKAALMLNAVKAAHAERKLSQASDLVATLTEHDAREFRQIGARRTVVLPPGYDHPIKEAIWSQTERQRRVAIIGSFEWTVKQLNLSHFLSVADARFAEAGIAIDIVGTIPADFRAAWEPKLKAARIHGYVKDLTTFFRRSRFGLIIERTGGGFKLKSLDYIFNGLPVAALQGSFVGIPESVSRHFLVAESAQALAESVIAIIEDETRLRTMQAGALRAAQNVFSWRKSAQDLLTAIDRLKAEQGWIGPRSREST